MSSALQEHIDYLSIEGRFELFKAAFDHVIQPGSVVADLGCGVGVLGLQCLNAGASKAIGIDASEAIHLARETMERAGLSERYISVAGSTFDTQLNEHADVLVCDHIGYFGFDYGVIDMVRDAAARMLKPGGVIVPDKIKLLVAGVSSPQCSDLASAWRADVIPKEYRWLDQQNRNRKFSLQFTPKQLCTAAAALGEIELNASTQTFFSFKAELIAERSGQFDGIAGWFDCHLGGDIWMTNSPLEARGIARPQAFLPVLEPFDVKAGDRIGANIRFNSAGDMIAWTITPPALNEGAIGAENEGGIKPQELSTFNTAIFAPGDLRPRSNGPVALSAKGKARAFVLSQMDGTQSLADITARTLERHPEFLPTEAAIREFVEGVVKRDGDFGGSE